jgi:type I restriction enzyme, R subunit
MNTCTEDALVQQTTAEYLGHERGWESVVAYNNEDFRPESLLGRKSFHGISWSWPR